MTQDSFDELAKATIQQTISKTLGEEVWKAISFYFDPRTVASDPEVFGKVLDKLFGSASSVLKQVIGQTLVRRVSGQSDKRNREFPEWIQIARAKFFSSTRLASTGQ